MINHITDCTLLNNNVEMPWLGLGVYRTQEGAETENAVLVALETGYRSIDTAALYKNEADVGRAIAGSGIPRQDIFITTKVWNSDQGYETTLRAFDQSLRKLKLDYVDLYLVHWPVKGRYVETWKALEKLYRDGLVRAIGLSNFLIHHIQDILAICQVRPVVNQVEFHPMLRQEGLHRFCIHNQIQLEAWAPLAKGRMMDHPTLVAIAEKAHKTPAQVLIRWDLQHEVVSIPKSSQASRIVENSRVFDFELSAQDMERIDQLDEDRRIGAHPDHFDF